MTERKPERRGLGRGLSALMADINLTPAAPEVADQGVATARRRPDLLPIEKLHRNPGQPRRHFSDDQLEDLAASIRAKGVLQPLIVRPSKDQPGHYEIVAGERRWRASQIAQLHEVPVLIRDFDDSEVLEVAIIENIQRADLNPIEEALAFRQLMDRFGHTQERLAAALSKSRSYIANLLRLLTLPEDVRKHVESGELSAGHARALITADKPSELARKVIDGALSVRATEQLVRDQSGKATVTGDPSGSGRKSGGGQTQDADTLALQQDLSANLKMPVSIRHEPGGEAGTVTIRYSTLDDLDFLCNALSLARRDMI